MGFTLFLTDFSSQPDKRSKFPVFEPSVAVEEAKAVPDDAGGKGAAKGAAGSKRKAPAAGAGKGKKAK